MWSQKMNVLITVILTSMARVDPVLGGNVSNDSLKEENIDKNGKYSAGDGDLEEFDPWKTEEFEEKARVDSFRITSPEDHPYSVLLTPEWLDGGEATCTGSLLTARWVLTAAHCVTNGIRPATLIQILAGALHSDDLSEGAQLLQSTEFYSHPRYKKKTPFFDIALIKTEKDFDLTTTVNTINLSTVSWRHDGYSLCTFTGFGKVQMYKEYPDDEMRKTHKLQVKKPCPCTNRISSTYGMEAVRKLICSKPRRDYGICGGDSGAGLVCDDELVAVASQIYMTRNAQRCTTFRSAFRGIQCGTKNTLSVFLYICPHLQWINDHVEIFTKEEINSKCTEPKSNAPKISADLTVLIVFTTLNVSK